MDILKGNEWFGRRPRFRDLRIMSRQLVWIWSIPMSRAFIYDMSPAVKWWCSNPISSDLCTCLSVHQSIKRKILIILKLLHLEIIQLNISKWYANRLQDRKSSFDFRIQLPDNYCININLTQCLRLDFVIRHCDSVMYLRECKEHQRGTGVNLYTCR